MKSPPALASTTPNFPNFSVVLLCAFRKNGHYFEPLNSQGFVEGHGNNMKQHWIMEQHGTGHSETETEDAIPSA
jgi:hypothetical protein